MKTTNFIGPQARCGAINNKGRVAQGGVVSDGPELFYGSTGSISSTVQAASKCTALGFCKPRGDSGLRLSPSENRPAY